MCVPDQSTGITRFQPAPDYRAGQTRANNAVAPLGASGDIVVYSGQSSGTTQFILDVNAYFQ